MKKRSLILEQESKSPILDSKSELAFPRPTRLKIVRVGHEGIVTVPRGELGHAEVGLLQRIQKPLSILERIELEKLSAYGHQGRNDRNRRRSSRRDQYADWHVRGHNGSRRRSSRRARRRGGGA